MPDYSKSKIYKITSPSFTRTIIGATTGSLDTVKKQYKKFDATVELIEDYPCNTKKELFTRKSEHAANTPGCVNKKNNYVEPPNRVLNKKSLIYQDDKQYIILHENNTYEVISKSSPDFKIPDDIFILTPRGLNSAIKGYMYDLERKKKAYQLSKEKLKVQKEEQQE